MIRPISAFPRQINQILDSSRLNNYIIRYTKTSKLYLFCDFGNKRKQGLYRFHGATKFLLTILALITLEQVNRMKCSFLHF